LKTSDLLEEQLNKLKQEHATLIHENEALKSAEVQLKSSLTEKDLELQSTIDNYTQREEQFKT